MSSTGEVEFTGIGGKFFVTAYAMSTVENVMTTSIDVEEGASGVVPDLVFTPVGSVTGRVTLEGASSGNGGSTVAVEGSDMMAATDDDGSFSFSSVRIGSHRLQAEHDGYEPAIVEIVPVAYDENTRVDDIVLKAISVGGTSPRRSTPGLGQPVSSARDRRRISIADAAFSEVTSTTKPFPLETTRAATPFGTSGQYDISGM